MPNTDKLFHLNGFSDEADKSTESSALPIDIPINY